MKLTEKELANLFQNSTRGKTSQNQACDCLSEAPASVNRIQQAEALMDDHIAAQSLKMAMGLQGWGQQLATAIEEAQRPWFNFWLAHNPLKATFATGALAMALIFSWSDFSGVESLHIPIQQSTVATQVVPNVINVMPFEIDQSDQLFQSNMENSPDALFNANFG